jgi:RP/EB family microtubule-associated protein
VRWVNHTLELEITDVEQLGTGAIYCQLFDCLYQGRVPMNKVNWRAKQEYEFLQNFKLLQGVLDRLGIDKKIDVALNDI